MEETTAADTTPSVMSDSTDINNNMEEDAKQLPSPEDQALAIEAAEAQGFAAGDQMHIISARWWGDWCAYSRYKQPASPTDDTSSAAASGDTAPPAPGPIDNSDILESFKGDLRPNLEEDKELVILTGQSWALLHGWYGGDQAIPRPAMLEGLAQKKARVMLYPLKLEVCWSGKPLEIKTMMAEKSETVRSLKERACAEFGVDPASTEIWDYFHNSKYSPLEPQLDKNLEEARILDEQAILLDDKENPLPVDTKSSSGPTVLALGSGRSFGRNASMIAEDMTMQRSDGRPGVVGLQNLGNTCFMNSSLQCLMHCVPIMRVFLSGLYEGDLNTSNPLGMKGQLATAFGSLMGNIWRPDVGAVVPKGFKAKIAQFAPQFSGYQQHDSQEFLAFLLDGLHEDINRIQVKPYIEEPDSEGRPDDELAAEAWANYRRRNDSHIVDHFQGLYKSTLVCPQCQYSSVKFDPFMYLSLPLPESKVRQLSLVLLHADGSRLPREYGLEVAQSGTVRDVYVALARVAGLELAAPEQQMVGAKLEARFNSYSLTPFEDVRGRLSEVCRDLTDTTLLVYYYRDPATGPAGPGNKKVVVYHRKRGIKTAGDGKFSAPLLLWLPEEATYDPALHVTPAPPPPPVIGSSSSSRGFDFCSSNSSSSRDSEFCVAGDVPIWGAIHTMLRPFLAPVTLQQPFLQQQDEQQDDYPAGGEDDAAAAGAEQQQQQQAGPGEACDVSMAAAPGLHNSPAATPSRQEGPAQQLQQQSPAAAAAGGGSDAAGGEDNSTWGSHGSDSPRSAMELGELAEPGEQQQPGAAAAGAAAAAPCASPVGGSGGSDGEPDANAAFAMQELNSGLEPSGAEAAGGGGGDGGVLIGAGGVPVAPLDMWGDASMQDTPADGGLDAAGAAGVVPYTLKLARDTGETKAGWYASHFHPKAFHYTFVLDWDMAAAIQMSLGDYLAAAEEAAEPAAAAAAATAAAWEEPAAAAAAGDDAHRLHPAAPCRQQEQEQHGDGGSSGCAQQCAQQQQQQQGEGQEQAWTAVHCWTPSLTPGTVMVDGQPATYEAVAAEPVVVCGGYVVSALNQPEYDASMTSVRRARDEARAGKSVELVACVEAFLQPEQLSEADEWYCPKCKEHVQADKKLDLWSLPEVLVVHLKRFSYTRWNRDKLDTQVLFPLAGLDLRDYVLHAQEQPPLYDCFAVSNHYGGLGGGHYTAFAQMPDDRKWFCFDDSRVDEMTPEAVQSRAAYVLFYRRRQQAAADPANQVELLLEQRQQHLQQKQQAAEAAAAEAAAAAAEAAAAEAAAGGSAAAASAMEDDAPLVLGAAPIALPAAAAAAAPGDNNLLSPAEGGSGDIWGSPSPGPPVAAAAGDATAGPAAGSPVAMLPRFTTASRLAAGRRGAGTDTTTTTTSSTAEDGDSSDGSSSRPRVAAATGRRPQPRQQQQQQQVEELTGADELAALNCGRRASDQELPADHDMADRDA